MLNPKLLASIPPVYDTNKLTVPTRLFLSLFWSFTPYIMYPSGAKYVFLSTVYIWILYIL